ncbi:TPA: choline BCCT transporter BetT [Acinetobacter nosocomialis]|uniref:BCCT family transporter n=1 Tax=Acinetobacter nosocomialis TaxID=106654 RepID=A0AB37CZ15_ACINO|nr:MULTISPECIES: choline BCCT transporter BetT [Acinetobacter calcoaceticus/baumannii complex]ELW77603.1 transporter, betaine/carnitine/choline family [Acinetobacter sp. OIFC021]EXE50518.1 transporter, betaine/carnitine/choline transporter family protein [Acinetobacter sp. 766875]MDE1664963.1 choline BCCT transporter BetT [Acinetobacter nosocomialis]QGA45627.1 BCCT family transporter [Acinetobacter nosocomialis]HDH7778546.1 choline BCCT transporter BetT [Acinetobacter nosocomialis]
MPSKQTSWFANVNPNVFLGTVIIIALFLAVVVIAPSSFELLTQQLKQWITDSFSWFYVLSVAFFLILLIYIACSAIGRIKLGPDHSQPEYSNGSWFAMLFTAGMGIGLMFFGVAEPVMHYVNPPSGDAQTIDAAQQALRVTFFHWGLHAWAIYAVVGLALAYFAYRHNLPLKTRSALYPLIGKKIYGPWGDSIDIFATIGTVFGVATSLGFGVTQINSGLHYLFGVEQSTNIQVLLIIFVSILASLSVFLGLDKGVKRLSELNLVLALILLVFVFIAGPSIYLLQTTIQNTGQYISNLFTMTFNLYAYQPNGWIGGWTILYWAWWISWSPFVGMFIARVSRGRTIREFIVGVLLIPTGFTIIWMGFLGNAALFSIIHEHQTTLIQAVQQDSSVALFEFLGHLPWSGVMNILATILVVLFFVTSADSGALVTDYLTAKTENSPTWQRLFWTVLMAVLAIILLLVGGLAALQSSIIMSALPFTVVMLLMSWGLIKALHLDVTKMQAIQEARITPRAIHNPRSWQQRLGLIMHYPHSEEEVKQYIEKQVSRAFENIQHEFRRRHLEVSISEVEDGMQLRVDHHHEINFIYKVVSRETVPPSFLIGRTETEDGQYFQAEVFLREGGQNYDVMDWTQEDLIQDIIDQYERHLHFLNIVRS